MMEGLGVNFLSVPAPMSTNSVQKDEVYAQVGNQMPQWSELIHLKRTMPLNSRMVMPSF